MARMGDLLLTDKEAPGLVISGVGSSNVPRPRWAAVGRVCSPSRLVIGALDCAMQRAWGLHGPAVFKDIGDSKFMVFIGWWIGK
jgi:L-asparaginase/Glu-tRNA(Gln) amidotransferase subunit D